MDNEVTNENRIENPSLFGMFGSPVEQFHRIQKNPKIIVALITITVLAIITALLTLKGMEAVLEEELLGLTGDELLIITIITQITTVIMATVVPAIMIVITAAVYLLIAKVANLEVSYKQLFSLFTYIAFVTGVGGLLNALFVYFVTGGNPEIQFTSLNILVGAEVDSVAGIIFSSVELFSIWGIILTAIGLQLVAKFAKPLAWGIVIGFNVIMVGFAIVLTIISQAIGV